MEVKQNSMDTFYITEIVEEQTGKVYELYGLSRMEAEDKLHPAWRNYLLKDGVRQKYKYEDLEGEHIGSGIFALEDRRYVGYCGLH